MAWRTGPSLAVRHAAWLASLRVEREQRPAAQCGRRPVREWRRCCSPRVADLGDDGHVARQHVLRRRRSRRRERPALSCSAATTPQARVRVSRGSALARARVCFRAIGSPGIGTRRGRLACPCGMHICLPEMAPPDVKLNTRRQAGLQAWTRVAARGAPSGARTWMCLKSVLMTMGVLGAWRSARAGGMYLNAQRHKQVDKHAHLVAGCRGRQRAVSGLPSRTTAGAALGQRITSPPAAPFALTCA